MDILTNNTPTPTIPPTPFFSTEEKLTPLTLLEEIILRYIRRNENHVNSQIFVGLLPGVPVHLVTNLLDRMEGADLIMGDTPITPFVSCSATGLAALKALDSAEVAQ